MSNEQDTILEVQGMTCPSCIRHVSSALTDLDGVGKVDVKFRDGIVVVEHDSTQASVAQLIQTLNAAGYASKQRSLECDEAHECRAGSASVEASILPARPR